MPRYLDDTASRRTLLQRLDLKQTSHQVQLSQIHQKLAEVVQLPLGQYPRVQAKLHRSESGPTRDLPVPVLVWAGG